MKGFNHKKTTTTMINSFLINTMEYHSASLDIYDFNYGMLTGMFERVMTKTSVTEIVLNSMKVVRRTITEGGGGPG